jgi:murein DD-endopeptidase MepM/ murein hydrolase activator NlpD
MIFLKQQVPVRKIILIITSAFLVALGMVLFVTPVRHSRAATESELRSQIDSANQRIQEIEQRIKEIGSNLNATSEERRTLEQELKLIEGERQKLLSQLELTSTKIQKTNLTIQDLEGEISEKEMKMLKQKKAIAESIQKIYQYDEQSPLELILSQEDMSSVWNEIDNLLTLQKASYTQIRALQGLQVALAQDVDQHAEQRDELEILKEDIESQKQLVERNRKQQQQLVSETKNKEEIYKQQLANEEAKRKAFEAEIDAYEKQLTFLSNPNALPSRGSAPLIWPLANITITQQFGAKTGPHRIYAHGHSGTDFRARTPEKVFAMANGVVMGTGDTDVACRGVSFGKWVTIKYDNNLVSTFGHLSLINVKKGDRVKVGQTVAYTGNTGRSTAPHLHVSLYAGVDANGKNPVEVIGAPSATCAGVSLVQPRAPREAYLNPLDYMPKASYNMFKEGVFEQG